jgi:hypothetical protein
MFSVGSGKSDIFAILEICNFIDQIIDQDTDYADIYLVVFHRSDKMLTGFIIFCSYMLTLFVVYLSELIRLK